MLYNSPSNKTNCLYVLSLLVALTTNKLIITKPNQKKNKNKQINKKINKIPKKKTKKKNTKAYKRTNMENPRN